MLRPQVFALSDGEVQIGLICSEKQAIDATLRSLAARGPALLPRRRPLLERARRQPHRRRRLRLHRRRRTASKTLTCTDKFGRPVTAGAGSRPLRRAGQRATAPHRRADSRPRSAVATATPHGLFEHVVDSLPSWAPDGLRSFCEALVDEARDGDGMATAIEALTLLRDRRFDTGDKRRSSVLRVVDEALAALFEQRRAVRRAGRHPPTGASTGRRATSLRAPEPGEETLVINAEGFPPEGDDCDARPGASTPTSWAGGASSVYGYRGQRFTGCGLGPDTGDVRIDVYGSSGDYLASGIDGLAIFVHGNAQDQLGQIMKRGKLVVYGDVGQTFLYGAKGGEVYVLGNAAGRPLINAVGRPRVVINGTCLDFLAESFMAGDPLNGGGFVDPQRHRVRRATAASSPQATPYPGQQPVLAGLRRRDLHPRPARHGRRGAAQRRRARAADRRGLAADPALPGGERAALRHQRSTTC